MEKLAMRKLTRHGLTATGILCFVAVAARLAEAQIPSIGSTAPQAAPPGQTMDIKIRGGGLAGPTQLWTSFPVEAVLPTEIAGNGTNAAEITYRLKIPADAPPGVHGLRVV